MDCLVVKTLQNVEKKNKKKTEEFLIMNVVKIFGKMFDWWLKRAYDRQAYQLRITCETTT